MNRIALLCLFISANGIAQPVGEALVKNRSSELLGLNLAPQAALVIVHDGRTYFAGRGGAQSDSLVRVGSISKVLATALMSKLAAEGKLRLTDSVAKYAPPGFQLPQPMTLLDLATHTSGIPRNLGGGDAWKALAGATMLAPAGTAAQYSNGGFWLLGRVLESAGGSPYDRQIREQILAPLGMRSTTATPDAEQCARLLVAREFPCVDARGVASTAGMYSTPHDMGIWLQHLLTDQSAAARVGHAQYVQRGALKSIEGLDSGGQADGIGLGWVHVNAKADRPALLEKTGGHDGFLSYIAFTPGGRTGVFMVIATMELDALRMMTRRVNELIGELSRQ